MIVGRHGAFLTCLFERQPSWGDEGTRVDLQPLPHQDSERVVNEILHPILELPTALWDVITRHAEGNPFYVEELIKMLLLFVCLALDPGVRPVTAIRGDPGAGDGF